MPPYDHYIVWNESIRQDLLRIYRRIKPEQIYVTGTPQFDFHFWENSFWSREEYCRRIGADPSRPIVLYTTGMPNHMPGEDIIVEHIADMCNRVSDGPKPQLVVRVYPKDRTNRFEKLRERRRDILFPHIPWELNYLTPMPEDLKLWPNMLQHCELGINIASTVTLELCMFDKPVLNVGYNPPGIDISPKDFRIYYTWDHYKPIVDSGALELPKSEEEMEKAIHQALHDPSWRREGRKALVQSFFGNTLDGKSYKRIGDKLLEFAGVRNN